MRGKERKIVREDEKQIVRMLIGTNGKMIKLLGW